MNFYVDKIQSFFQSIAKYFSETGYAFSWLFIIFMGAFVAITLVIIFSSSFTYECVLTRAIDKINKFLSKNPKINDDNLIAFNNKMKDKSIPKVLRRQWQQFMLYREHEASHYMSFKHCVENPLKNSTYNQQMGVYRVISFILAFLSLLIGVFTSYESSFKAILQDVVIIPIFIMVLYWLVSMVLNLIHNATTADLFQNYQYFEINIDKATMTLPEYVDYEVLFTQAEIKKGIPVLFEYIQKRAIEEQQELEKARIKNIEHEKFNFDDSGIDASLVLERSMTEAESYIATRKKFMQDIEQVNNEISQLENQYRENVKENQRLMQTSKESLDGLKKQLEQASSSIETNYIKKQMKDEVNRQQMAERDFDAMTDKYNQEQKNMQAEIGRLQGEIDSAKKELESNMMSEFTTYSNKVYKKLEEVVGNDQKEILDEYKKQINDLEEKLSMKDQELDNVYSQYRSQMAEMEKRNKDFDNILREKDDFISSVQEQLEEGKSAKPKSSKFKKKKHKHQEELDEQPNWEEPTEQSYDDYNNSFDNETQSNDDWGNGGFDDFDNTQGNDLDFDTDNAYDDDYDEDSDFGGDEGDTIQPNAEDDFNYLPEDNAEENDLIDEDNSQDEGDKTDLTFDYLSNNDSVSEKTNAEVATLNAQDESLEDDKTDSDITFDYLPSREDNKSLEKTEEEPSHDEDSLLDEDLDAWLDDDDEEVESGENVVDEGVVAGQPDVDNEETENETELTDEDETASEDEPDDEFVDEDEFDDEGEDDDGELVVDNYVPVKRGPGRPRKEVDDSVKVKRGPGRPRKLEKTQNEARRVGRPRKEVNDSVTVKRGPGRPKKLEDVKRPVGRPRKVESEKTVARPVGRPRKTEQEKPKRSVGRPKKARPVGRPKKTNPVGRPRKNNVAKKTYSKSSLNDIDKRLKELNEQIKRENQNLAKTKRQLEKASLKKNR